MPEQPGLAETRLWITVARAVSGGRAARDYVVYDDSGDVLGTAQAFPWRREIPVRLTADGDAPAFVLRRRRAFPLNGKVDVVDAHGRRIGLVTRSGRYRDAAGRLVGSFRDARTLGDWAKEGLFIGVMEAVVGGDGSEASSPSRFVHMQNGRPAGRLMRLRAPFECSVRPHNPERGGRLRRILPQRLGDALFEPAAPVAWCLENLEASPSRSEDPRLRLAAALFAIELSHWWVLARGLSPRVPARGLAAGGTGRRRRARRPA